MGLGPSICGDCGLFADYHPNKENPRRQGDWLCPKCGFDCDDYLFRFPKSEWEMIRIRTTIVKENKGS